MNGKLYLKEKVLDIGVFMVIQLLICLFGKAFRVPSSFLIMLFFLPAAGFAGLLIWDYAKRRRFYREFFYKLEQLEEKYLITEVMEEPELLEGRLFLEALYSIDRSMKERINALEDSVVEFREYLELWVHEIKVPLSALLLMNYNQSMAVDSQRVQLQKMSRYVEQILFYARSDAPQKDYLMKRCSLDKIVNKVLIAQKELLIGSHMQIEKQNLAAEVITDAKWLEFMLGQIINNSVKYRKGEKGELMFGSYETQDKTVLVVEDHGAGIRASDLARIFDKTFTGENGHKTGQATGMGLYICKKLCRKLGHDIWAESKEGEYTKIFLAFGKNEYYDDVVR